MKALLSKYLSEKLTTVLFYCLAVCAMEAQYMIFLYQIGEDGSIFHLLIRTFGEVLLITSPYWFAGPKWRRMLPGLSLLFTAFVICNVLLYRPWGDIMGVSYLRFTGNINSNLLLSAVSLWQPGDTWILITGILPTLFYFFARPLNYRFRMSTRLWLTGASVMICCGGYAIRVRSAYIYYNQSSQKAIGLGECLSLYASRNQQNASALKNGALVYLCLMVTDLPDVLFSGKIELSNEEKAEIKGYLDSLPNISHPEFEKNADKNLIIVVVESLESYVVDAKIGGVEVTPNLNSLLKEEGTVQARKVISQVGEGRSVDGQMILTTGLLPFAKGITWMRYPRYFAAHPSLPKLYDRESSFCLFSTDGKYWQERDYEENIGFGKTAINSDYQELIDTYGADGALFRKGAEIAGSLRRPFILMLVTSSMHTPYEEPKAEKIPVFRKEDEQTGKYLEMTRYFDDGFGKFIASLKEKGLYDNSVIIVVSDHSRTRNFGSQTDMETFFAAFNTGRTENIGRTVGQVNLYPTILTIMNRKNPDGYLGIAPDIFDPAVTGAEDSQGNIYGKIEKGKASPFMVSDKMIRSDFRYNR